MTIHVIYLRADDQAQLVAALTAAGMWDAEAARIRVLTRGDALDVIGTIYEPTGEVLEIDGEQVPQAAPVPGWHANLLLHGDPPAELAEITIDAPASPARMFAGLG